MSYVRCPETCFRVKRLDQYFNMANINPAQFIKEVRQETSKVTWPTRKETGISTAMVFVMVIVAALFFLLVDWVLNSGVKLLFGFGG